MHSSRRPSVPLLLMPFLALLVACVEVPAEEPPSDDELPPTEEPLGALVNTSCLALEDPPPADVDIELEEAFDGELFRNQIKLIQHPTDDDRWYVVRQRGQIETFLASDPPGSRALAIELTSVGSGYEQGLLSMAFAPDFATSGIAYVSYTDRTGSYGDSVVGRIESSDGGLTFSPHANPEVMRFPQPAANHNGGDIAFGPDGYLYIAFGDGGGGGDPFRHGQNKNSLFGAILRIDVSDPTQPYGIPSDNPFVDEDGADEIWAYGLRNPWRMGFDPGTGALLAADVGQGAVEEANLIVRGGNYGWPLKEGSTCFRPVTDPCDGLDVIDPIFEYGRSLGYSTTGGYVYRGTTIPSLQGLYILGDYGSGNIWAVQGFDQSDPQGSLLIDSALQISSFAQDRDGEIYVLDLHLFGGDVAIYKIVPASDPGPDEDPDASPALLSESGCVMEDDPERLASGVVPYAIRAPFHSDGAAKSRGMALPDGATLTIGADGDLEFPVGTVRVKQFYLDDEPIETRLFKRHPSGWRGYSYAWNVEGTDAELLRDAEVVEFGGQDWLYPSPSQCRACHTVAAGRALGPELGQLDRDFDYPAAGFALFDRPVNQLAALRGLRLLPASTPPEYEILPGYDDESAPLADRARAYLHSNCSHCHRPGGGGRGDLDLRYATALADSGLCDEPTIGGLGLDDPRVVSPGEPGRSVLLERMLRLDGTRMPPLASSVVDSEGTTLIEDWIDALPSCP